MGIVGVLCPIMLTRSTKCGMLPLLAILLVVLSRADSADEQLLLTIENRVDIQSSQGKPFQLEADFSAQMNVPQEGHITWKWLNKDNWSQVITLGGYGETKVRKGEILYISHNAPFTPLRVSELLSLLAVSSSVSKYWEVKKVKQQSKGGPECLELRKTHSKSGEWNPKRTACIDPNTKELLTDEYKDEEELRREEYAAYQGFGAHSYPRQMKFYVNGSVVLKVTVVSLREVQLDESEFVAPPGAVARRQCEGMSHPIALKTPDPDYPPSASQNRLGGTVTVSLTVEPDGSVSNVQLLESAGHEMDSVSQQIVKTWKFKPAMCGTEPVAYDIHVSVTFHPR